MTDPATRDPILDLQQFCSKDEHRRYIMNPWSRAGFTWATDGRILIRVPLRADVPENPEAPHAERVLGSPEDAKAAPLPAVKWPRPPEPKECKHCDGRGTEHECPDCTCYCDECDGSGFEPIVVSVDVRGVPFDSRYIRMIVALPGAEFSQAPDKRNPSPFRFDGGTGVLSPMNGASRKHHLGDIEKMERA